MFPVLVMEIILEVTEPSSLGQPIKRARLAIVFQTALLGQCSHAASLSSTFFPARVASVMSMSKLWKNPGQTTIFRGPAMNGSEIYYQVIPDCRTSALLHYIPPVRDSILRQPRVLGTLPLASCRSCGVMCVEQSCKWSEL